MSDSEQGVRPLEPQEKVSDERLAGHCEFAADHGPLSWNAFSCLTQEETASVVVELIGLRRVISLQEAPERIWWCFGCHAGVGLWGLDDNKPPGRCPSCHAFNFAPMKFAPERTQGGEA